MSHKIPKYLKDNARYISNRSVQPWYICTRSGRSDILVSENDLKRYLRLGYTVVCAYLDGKRYGNVYRIDGTYQFVL